MMPVGVLDLYGFLCFGCPGNLRPPYLRWHQRSRAEAELEHQEDVLGGENVGKVTVMAQEGQA